MNFVQAMPVQAAPVSSSPAEKPATSSSLGSTPAAQPALGSFSDAGADKALQTALRSDLHVGVQTEAFGRVTIQTSAAAGQLSAQLSLENTKQSAALAPHLAAVEQKLTQQFGLNASVSLASGSGRSFGNSSTSDGGRGSEPNEQRQKDSSPLMARDARQNSTSPGGGSGPVISSVGTRYSGSSSSSKLDITV
jgi:hypothetical protein